MEHGLVIAFGVGVLLCFVSWIMVSVAGFRHHVVTGIFAMIPGVNLLVLPTVWHRAYFWFFAGLIGLLLTFGSWFLGARPYVSQYIADFGIALPSNLFANNTNPSPASAVAVEQPVANTPNSSVSQHSEPNTKPDTLASETVPVLPNQALPPTALYQMTFQVVPLDKVTDHIGQYVRVVRNDRKQIEGKLLEVSERGIKIERNINGGTITYDVSQPEISELQVMQR